MKAIATAITVVCVGLVGCASEVPRPAGYELSSQSKMVAAHHWDVLAGDVANRLAQALGTEENAGLPRVLNVHRPPRPTVFNVAFHDLLVTQLIQQGFGIAIEPTEDALDVIYDVKYGGQAGVSVSAGTSHIHVPDNDIIVNISVVKENRYVTRMSEIFYIDGLTRDEYFGNTGAPTRLVEVVGPE